MSAAQMALFEPTPAECGPLALQHLRHAETARRAAQVARSRGWPALADAYRKRAEEAAAEADDLAALADLYKLARVEA